MNASKHSDIDYIRRKEGEINAFTSLHLNLHCVCVKRTTYLSKFDLKGFLGDAKPRYTR